MEKISKKLMKHVHLLSQTIGNRSVKKKEELDRAANYIDEQLRHYGYQVERQCYCVSIRAKEMPDPVKIHREQFGIGRNVPTEEDIISIEVCNIIATKIGIEYPDEIIIFAAHYDTCDNPGADDNASGIAGILEIARLLSGMHTRRTIKLIAFVNEEPPYFHTEQMGSLVYAKDARLRNEDIKLAVVLEMIGYYSDDPDSQQIPFLLKDCFISDTGNFIMGIGNPMAFAMLQDLEENFNDESTVLMKTIIDDDLALLVEGIDYSDHWSFWQQNYPAVMITDTAFLRNPNYHQPTDTWDTLKYQQMAEVVKGLAQYLKIK